MKKRLVLAMIMLLTFIIITPFATIKAYAKNEIIPILLYHNITEINDTPNKLHVSKDIFNEHMKTIKYAGYNTITYNDYYNYVVYAVPLPENPIIISFDDGYLSNYTYGFPVLKELKMNATIFIITKNVGAFSTVIFPHFTWEQAREMQNSGFIEFGSHTHSHLPSTTLSLSDLTYELRKSKYLIEMNLGIKCNVLAYPYGDANVSTRTTALMNGYKIVNLVGDVGVNKKDTPLDGLKRLTVSGDMRGIDVLRMILANLDK